MNLLVTEPGRPRLTWYGDDGERVELSGAVLANWLSKTTNLLVEEFDAGPGRRICVDLPAHWRSAVWALAAWRCGATVVLPEETARPTDVDAVVTTRPRAWGGATDVVAVALPVLARRYDGELPAGAIDAAGAVMTYADMIVWAPEADPDEPALDSPGSGTVTHGDLLAWAAAEAARAGARVLVDGRAPLAAVLRRLLGVWSRGGSAVLASAATAAELEADPDRRERLVTQEGVTA